MTIQHGDVVHYHVETRTSNYMINLVNKTVTRSEKLELLPSEDFEDFEHSSLRKDGEEIPLISMDTPVVGKSLHMILDIRGDGIPTIRQTTEVTDVFAITASRGGSGKGIDISSMDIKEGDHRG